MYFKGDFYEILDVVFGVKKSFVIEFGKVDKEIVEKYGVEEGIWLFKYDFVFIM